MLSVDGDTSTSDTCVLIRANGHAGRGRRGRSSTRRCLLGCVRMTEMLARDGEGAEHLLRVTVSGAAGRRRGAQSRQVGGELAAGEDDGARRGPQCRTPADGGGQVLRLHDRSYATTDAWINGYQVVRDGTRLDFDESDRAQGARGRTVVDIEVRSRRRGAAPRRRMGATSRRGT